MGVKKQSSRLAQFLLYSSRALTENAARFLPPLCTAVTAVVLSYATAVVRREKGW